MVILKKLFWDEDDDMEVDYFEGKCGGLSCIKMFDIFLILGEIE